MLTAAGAAGEQGQQGKQGQQGSRAAGKQGTRAAGAVGTTGKQKQQGTRGSREVGAAEAAARVGAAGVGRVSWHQLGRTRDWEDLLDACGKGRGMLQGATNGLSISGINGFVNAFSMDFPPVILSQSM